MSSNFQITNYASSAQIVFFFYEKDSCKVNSRTILEDIKSIQKLLLPLLRRSNIFEFFSEKLLIQVLLDSFQRFVR